MNKQQGFTLIELVITIVILGILAAIAIPSYRQFLIKNSESQAQARMATIQMDLDKWRASTLTFSGFRIRQVADNGEETFTDATTISVPTNNPKYTIELTNGQGGALSSAARDINTVRAGTSWVMVARPTQDNEQAKVILMNSQGQRCMSEDRNFCPDNSINDCSCEGEISW
ncbi:type IV pilin protein [Moraxella bovis]|uniref:Pilin n=1 Tax=Moraxella bovis TaxID=476 RepID=A0A378PXY4_MORBO|nr:prepilin-type N-terminal cleavage/methylation domain-containing protein [Moraxella bovis]STY93146.1 Pilin [Moraxella bovis]